MEKEEPALGGLSIEYSDVQCIKQDINCVLRKMNAYDWKNSDLEEVTKMFSKYMALLWKVYPYREGNTRCVIVFCTRFIEAQGWFVDSDLYQKNAAYMRTALVAANAIFHDIGDKRKTEYIEQIIYESLYIGLQMKQRIINQLKEMNIDIEDSVIKKIAYWNRREAREHTSQEIIEYLSTND